MEPEVHFSLGFLYWKSQKYDEAAQEFQQELTNYPGHAQSLAYLGDIAMKNDNPEEALTYLRKAVALKNDIRIAYIDLGNILAKQRNYSEAIPALKRAVELDPEQSDAHYRLANIYRAMGNAVEAEKEMAAVRALQVTPEQGAKEKAPVMAPSPDHP
jgi:predicted Zn-dependent protease